LQDGRGGYSWTCDIRNAFKSILDQTVEIDDEEDVLVKKRNHPDFAIKPVGSTVKGIRVDLDRG
jgi:hypothetical protein